VNLLRTLTKRQLYHLQEICEGRTVILWDAGEGAYFEQTSGDYRMRMPHGNDRQRRRNSSKRPWLGSCVVTLLQRKVLVDEEGRLVPCKAAARLFGRPPRIEPPKKSLKMSRTRAARDQDAPPKQRKGKPARDRTGQVWEHLGEARLILGPPKTTEPRDGAFRRFDHPSLDLLDGAVGAVLELEEDAFEGKRGYKRLA